jgi:hypothetical protein
MNTAAIRVGRLLEIRATSYRSRAEVAALFKAIGGEVAKMPATTQIVTVTDWRYCPIMSDDAAEYALAGMTKGNSRVLRSGALASQSSPTAVLQFLRLVRESKHDSRRLFFSESELTSWLGEVLTSHEQVRLVEFLREPVEIEPRPRGARTRQPPPRD